MCLLGSYYLLHWQIKITFDLNEASWICALNTIGGAQSNLSDHDPIRIGVSFVAGIYSKRRFFFANDDFGNCGQIKSSPLWKCRRIGVTNPGSLNNVDFG